MDQAMISSEVQRTLVKSPPELWAELSDPEALTRHLGALGEIRITRAEPEKLVEWEAEGTSGVVQIKPSGWGTKVTLSVTREVELAEQPAVEDAVSGDAASDDEPAGEDAEPIAAAVAPPEPEAEPEPEPEPEPTIEAVEDAPDTQAVVAGASSTDPVQDPEVQGTEPRRGFFARIFGRRRPRASQHEPTTPEIPMPEPSAGSEPEDAPASSAIELLQARFAPAEPEPVSEAPPAPVAEPAAAPLEVVEEAASETMEESAEKPVDLAAELQAAEEVAAEEVTAVLTAALDRLGAAHHRPFSRA